MSTARARTGMRESHRWPHPAMVAAGTRDRPRSPADHSVRVLADSRCKCFVEGRDHRRAVCRLGRRRGQQRKMGASRNRSDNVPNHAFRAGGSAAPRHPSSRPVRSKLTADPVAECSFPGPVSNAITSAIIAPRRRKYVRLAIPPMFGRMRSACWMAEENIIRKERNERRLPPYRRLQSARRKSLTTGQPVSHASSDGSNHWIVNGGS